MKKLTLDREVLKKHEKKIWIFAAVFFLVAGICLGRLISISEDESCLLSFVYASIMVAIYWGCNLLCDERGFIEFDTCLKVLLVAIVVCGILYLLPVVPAFFLVVAGFMVLGFANLLRPEKRRVNPRFFWFIFLIFTAYFLGVTIV